MRYKLLPRWRSVQQVRTGLLDMCVYRRLRRVQDWVHQIGGQQNLRLRCGHLLRECD